MDRRIAGWLLLAAAVAGCQDNDLGLERRRPNRPPDTVISGRPPTTAEGTDSHVHLYWAGFDGDGRIDHFDYILVDHPASGDPRGTVDSLAAGHGIVAVPAEDDPRWTAIARRDSVFVTSADSLPRPPQPAPGETNEFVRRQSFQRWHTFFVRAVDNEGLSDPTPDYASFNATTLAPTVALSPPIAPGFQFQSPPTVVFQWTGDDPSALEGGLSAAPIASRWVLFQSSRNIQGHYAGFPESLYVGHVPWSPWHAWDASDGSGQRTIVRDLQPVDSALPGSGFYVFAVQAMDEAGAVTPVFDDVTLHKNNAVRVFVSGLVGPMLVVQDRFLGTYNFAVNSQPMLFDIGAQQPVHFQWHADAHTYGGSIAGYRYGWDIRNLDDDTAWEQGWSATATSAPERLISSGVHRFYLEVRDDAGTVARATIELTSHALTRRRSLLLVDDTFPPRSDLETPEDERWAAVLGDAARAGGFIYDPVGDVYEVRSTTRTLPPPPLTLVFDYRAVVWPVIGATGNGLRALTSFFDPFLPANAGRVATYNYLDYYLESGGRLWICGSQPANLLWPFTERPRSETQQVPVNVVHWNHDLHPTIDSVGVRSFLYKMGIEAFDLGNGGRAGAPRVDALDQGCISIRRATPQGSEERTFGSSVEVGHAHEVTIPTVDVEAEPPVEHRYTTSSAAGHVHELVLGPEDFRALRGGARLVRITTASTTPAPHTHEFVLEDALVEWGAPPQLTTEAFWPLPPDRRLNPLRSRPNIEIYNMPQYMEVATPPLRPIPGLTLIPYVYTSALPEGSTPAMHYPLTADGQPVLVLRKKAPEDRAYSRAFCGFEPWLLDFESHRKLTEYILLRAMRLDEP